MQTKKLITVLRRSIVVLSVLALVLGGIVVVGNNFRFTQISVTIPGPQGDLAGVLTRPERGSVRGLVVMVHGDGAVDATRDGLYSPWFEGAADAGLATLSWNKPGVGGSDGNWLRQSMEDRASEVSAVIEWAKKDERIPTDTIFLWGASQAGWVLPKVVSERNDIDGVVAVGTAINWLRQGSFNLLAEFTHDGIGQAEREMLLAESDGVRAMLDRRASYGQYLRLTTTTEPMTEDRWGFVLKNYSADAAEDLVASAAQEVPVHLMVGNQDRNVDVAETERTYRLVFGPLLSVTHFDGAHSLARTAVEDSDTLGLLTGLIWPRALMAPGVIADYTLFLSSIDIR